MARLMSVALTTPQVRDRSKTVTRRLGWLMLKEGDRLTLCAKVQGRKPGEPLERICDVEVVSVRREPLAAISFADCIREGFPAMQPREFEAFFCGSHKDCTPESLVTRIEWRYLTCSYCACPYDESPECAEGCDHRDLGGHITCGLRLAPYDGPPMRRSTRKPKRGRVSAP